jgi:hypothetical protein
VTLRASRLLLCSALLSPIVLVSGCGTSAQPIPVDIAQGLIAEIDAVEQGVRDGECRRMRSTLQRMEREVEALPPNTDEEVRRTLGTGIAHLGRLAQGECKQKRPPVRKPKKKPAPTIDTTPGPVQTPEPEPEVEPEPERQIEEPQVEEPVDEGPSQEEQSQEEEPQEEPDDGGGGGEVPDPCAENPGPTC